MRTNHFDWRFALTACASALLLAYSADSRAGGQGFRPTQSQSGSFAQSSSVSGSTARATLSAGLTSNPVAESSLSGGSPSASTKTTAYGYTKAALTTSQGECPLLGSVDLFIVAGTYEIARCAMWRDVEMMQKAEFTKDSVLNRICQEESIARVSSECTNRTMTRP